MRSTIIKPIKSGLVGGSALWAGVAVAQTAGDPVLDPYSSTGTSPSDPTIQSTVNGGTTTPGVPSAGVGGESFLYASLLIIAAAIIVVSTVALYKRIKN